MEPFTRNELLIYSVLKQEEAKSTTIVNGLELYNGLGKKSCLKK